jgi:bifunctional non-homologous end joining protein LigD
MRRDHGSATVAGERHDSGRGSSHELAAQLPADVQLDGELVAYDDAGRPDFHRLGARMLHGKTDVPVTYMVFDVLAVEGLATTRQPYSERRALLDELQLERRSVRLVATFDDGPALFDAILEHGLEGVVAKREREAYRPDERLWVKQKNRGTARFAEEVAGVGRRRQPPSRGR